MAGEDNEMFMIRCFNVTQKKTTEQHLNVRTDKSVAYETYNKRQCWTFFCTMHTDRYKASRDLCATAELLVADI